MVCWVHYCYMPTNKWTFAPFAYALLPWNFLDITWRSYTVCGNANVWINWLSHTSSQEQSTTEPMGPSTRTKTIFYLRPDESTENDQKCCSSDSSLYVAPGIHQKQTRGDGACTLSLRAVNKQTIDGETKHSKKKMKMASARKPESFMWTVNEVELLLGLTLNYKASKLQERFNIFCGTTTSSTLPLLLSLLLLLWDVTGFRGRRQEVKGWGDGVIVLESMQIHCPHENWRAAFADFSTLRPIFKKVRFQALRFQDPCGWSAKTMQYIFFFRKRAVSSGRPLYVNRAGHCPENWQLAMTLHEV